MSFWKKYLHMIRNKEVELISDFLRSNNVNSCIEFGAGDGFQTGLLSRYFSRYVSTDLNMLRLENNNKIPGVEYRKIDADNFKSQEFSEKFDIVFSSNMLEHLEKPSSFLRESLSILTNNGHAIHVVPSRWIKVSYIIFYYFYLLKLFFSRLLNYHKNKRLFGGFSNQNENNINAPIKKYSKIKKIIHVLQPSIHGNYRSHYKEFVAYGKQSWLKLFQNNGYQLCGYKKGPAFSGFGFGISVIREVLEKCGIFSEHIFILKKEDPGITVSNSMFNVAVIPPKEKGEYLTNTLIDGLLNLSKDHQSINIKIAKGYKSPLDISHLEVDEHLFVKYAKESDVIFFCRLDNGQTNFELMEKIGCFQKTIFIDGSEFRGDFRLNYKNQKDIIDNKYTGFGAVNLEMLKKVGLYARREKPYIDSIYPFTYAIENRYLNNFSENIEKDIDFVCIFGQDSFSPMRKYVVEILENFCKKNNFTFYTSKTKNFSFEDSKKDGRDEFYSILARSKVGISVSGGGFDTARFWETLANNCLLLTEKIDIYFPDEAPLNYDRIYEFGNLFDFEYQLNKLGLYLRSEYQKENLNSEYKKIIQEHGTKKRVLDLLLEAQKRGVFNKVF